MNAVLRLQRLAAKAALSLPAPLLALAARPVVVDGQRLDPQLAAGLAWAHRFGPRLHELPVARARRASDATFRLFDAAPVAMERVRHLAAPGPAGPIPIRLYVPRRHAGGMLVWFHGGGGVIGSVAAADWFTRHLADRAGCLVASVDYRLGPEHPHPAAIDDAVAAWRWLTGQARELGADPARIAVGGDSFGGFLSVWVERRGKALGLPRPRASLLFYPVLDLTHSLPSHQLFADGFGLTAALVRWFRAHYAPDPASWRDGSPLFAADVAGIGPTLLVTAGFDCLRDDAPAWIARVRAAGGDVDHRVHAGLIHGFIGMTNVCRAAAVAVDEAIAWLAAAIAR